MADAQLDNLIRKVNRLVAEHTGGVSFAPPELAAGHRKMIEPLAENLDLPARLAPSVDAVLDHRYGQAYDRRTDIRVGLTELVALCANSLEPSVRAPAEPDDRSRLAIAVSRAYAAFATPQLVPRLFQNGRPDDLGRFPLPVLEGDVAAARAMAVAIGARTGRGEGDVLTALVADGHGGAAGAAARLLLKARMGYSRLPEPEQQALVRRVAGDLESGFAVRDLRAAAERELTEVLENRREDVAGGAGTVDAVSTMAAREIEELHDFLDQRPEWHSTNDERAEEVATVAPPGPRIEPPESVYQLARRIEGAVGELTGAPGSRWNGRLQEELGQAPDTTLRLTREQAIALGKLLESSEARPLGPADASAAREAMQVAASSYARWAVPTEYDHRHEAAAQAVAPRFAAIEQAVGTAFAEDNFREIVDRSLPAELADQVLRAAPPEPDQQYAPAAREFANAVDTAVDRQPGETLRQMAGEGRARMALVAAEALVADSAVENVERPFAVRLITEEIDRSFDELPLENPHGEGHWTAKVAEGMAEVYGDDPGAARREADAADRAQAENPLRFAPGHDPATATPRTTTAPANAPTALQSGASLQAEPRDRNR